YTITKPWLWWQYITCGFTHSPVMFGHILGNMLVLFFLGRDVEERYGSKEFLRLYLTMVVFAAVVWNVANKLVGDSDMGSAYGASGAIAGVVVLYALNFPHRTLLLFFVIPMPAWLLGALVVLYDIYGAVVGGDQVAYSMHLAGAAFAFIYFQQRWNLTRLTEGRFRWLRSLFRKKPRLKVHGPEKEVESDMTKEVDRLLEKISREGEASLTAKERRILETASREYQRRGKGGRQ
ncbi:MAG: rhomboid family intramembrane serine protease, partial [Planctomycetes bacterium]|nr:rhomboid family intramembrane serine protease [Planctomycetota bacterium]